MVSSAMDIWHLKHRLRIAIAVLPFAAAPFGAGCTKQTRGEPEKPQPVLTADAGVVTTVTPPQQIDAEVVVVPQKPEWEPPSCPSGAFCTTKAEALSVKQGKETVLDCPTDFDQKKLASMRQDKRPGQISEWVQVTFDEAKTTAERATSKDACCYTWFEPCPGGRPALEGGRAVVAAVVVGEGRPGVAPGAAQLSPAQQQALADAWLADALAEHASIASFARATLELMAVGAPAELIAATQRAGLDEVRHARDCFALASAYAGQVLAADALPALTPREADLVRLARDTFAEGCVGETTAALAASRALAGCTDPAVKKVLARIVKDELRHAELAWRTVAWAAAAGGQPVIDAIRDELAAAQRVELPAIEADTDATIESLGRLGQAARSAAIRDALGQLIEPLVDELSART